MLNIMLYNYLSIYGTVYETTHKLLNPDEFVEWTEDNFEYVRYNPRKKIERFGLSVTSYDGGMSGIPDLDSLREYNKENNTRFSESDFKVPTPVYYYKDLHKILKPIEPYIFRSHILKLNPGGFFPPHRDFGGVYITSFRLLIPLKNTEVPAFNFIIEDKIQHWNNGSIYFVDTAKMHYLFNSGGEPVYLMVLNVQLAEQSIKFVTENLRIRV